MNVVEHRPIYRRVDLAAKKPVEVEPATEEDIYARATRIVREDNVWAALQATAQASQQQEGGNDH